jgi:hypothetical protein
MENSDLRDAAARALAILKKLAEHEGSVSLDDDLDDVLAVRFALLDAAQEHLAAGLDAVDAEGIERVPEPIAVAG